MTTPVDKHDRPARRRVAFVATIIAAFLIPALPLLIVLDVENDSPSGHDIDKRTAEAVSLPTPTGVAPAADVARVHQALHTIGKVCRRDDKGTRRIELRGPVAEILSFTRRYPDAGFRVDDESASTLSLLLVTRSAVKSCEPGLLAGIEKAIPEQYRPDR